MNLCALQVHAEDDLRRPPHLAFVALAMTNVFILLFRGINFGGNKIVRMETLRNVLLEAGFKDAKTYIQSGNVVLSSDGDANTLIATIERIFPATFGFSSRPTVRSLEAWQQLIADNPFANAPDLGQRLHAVLLDSSPTDAAVDALIALATTERIALGDGVLYLHTPDGFGTSKVAAMLDRLLKVPCTARNWNTVLRLEAMAKELTKA